MNNREGRPAKRIGNSDSDYKAEDEGSASDNPALRRYRKTPLNLKLTKKDMIEQSIRTLLPLGVALQHDARLTIQQYESLLNIQDAEELSLKFRSMIGKVLEVIDGQTLKIAITFDGKPIKALFRLNGLCTPEIRKCETKQFGGYVKKLLREMIEGRLVRVQTGQYDKQGRILCRVYAYSASPLGVSPSNDTKNGPEFCINDFLINNDMARCSGNKNKSDFTRRDFEVFTEKYEAKVWPAVDNYPLGFVKGPIEADYEEKEEEYME